MTTAHALDQVRLLDVQALDTRLTQIEHQRTTLPQLEALAQLSTQRQRVHQDLTLATTEVGDLRRELKKAEDFIDVVKTRQQRDQELLDSGAGSPRDLLGLQHELETLENRKYVLEEEALEIMERLDAAQGRVDELQAELDGFDTRRTDLETERDNVFEKLAAETAKVQQERETIAEGLDQGLMVLYENVRARNYGLGAAMFRGGRCEACRMQLPPAEVAKLKAAPMDHVMHCSECDRILVRTTESGL